MEGTACSAKTFAVAVRKQSAAIAGAAVATVATVATSNAKAQVKAAILVEGSAAEAVARSQEQD